MSTQETPVETSNKRRRTEQHSPRAKRRRLDAGTAEQRSLSFWDGLSEFWLTKDALRELDRRNSSLIAQPASRRVKASDRPVTRKSFAEQRDRHRTQTADEFLHVCTSEGLKTIKRFARSGGIDLRDLRGVCMRMYSRDCCAKADSAILSTRNQCVPIPCNPR